MVYNQTVHKLFRTLTLVALFLTVALGLPTQAHAQTQAWGNVCVAGNEGYGSGDVATIQGFQCLLGNILTIIFTLIGFAGLLMLIIGSFRYLLSGGNSKGTESAKNTITYAVIGLVVALSALIIVNLIAAFTGIDAIKVFTIPDSTTLWNP